MLRAARMHGDEGRGPWRSVYGAVGGCMNDGGPLSGQDWLETDDTWNAESVPGDAWPQWIYRNVQVHVLSRGSMRRNGKRNCRRRLRTSLI